MTINKTDLLGALDRWIQDNPAPQGTEINESRILNVIEIAQKTKACLYNKHGKKASPFKDAACACYAIATELPVATSDLEDYSKESSAVLKYNASFAAAYACRLLSGATFDCAPQLKPPFRVGFPSQHFKKEFISHLAWQHLSPPAIALIFELLFYRCNQGAKLIGKLDKTSGRLKVSP